MTSVKRNWLAAGVVAASLLLSPAAGEAKDFASWLQKLRTDALAEGVSAPTVQAMLPDTLQPIPRIIELDRKQPEKTRTLDQYLASVVSMDRRNNGRTHYLKNQQMLNKIGRKYGVDPAVIVALWGVETSYGKITGGYKVVDALATLAYDGRRSDFFRSELMKALHIADEHDVAPDDFRGSWAGAMGQCQFMPSSFLRFAVDENGDGRRDIWDTQMDVFGSAANYLSQSGWKAGQMWGHEVTIPKALSRKLIGLEQSHSLQFWRQHDIRGMGGQQVADDATLQASLIQPDGAGGRVFLVYDNYKVILQWNRSTYFATAVGLLSDHIRTGTSTQPQAAGHKNKHAAKKTAPATTGGAAVIPSARKPYND